MKISCFSCICINQDPNPLALSESKRVWLSWMLKSCSIFLCNCLQFPNAALAAWQKAESLVVRTRLSHIPSSAAFPRGAWRNWIWVRNVTESSQGMDVTLALCDKKSGDEVAWVHWYPVTPYCSPFPIPPTGPTYSVLHRIVYLLMVLLLSSKIYAKGNKMIFCSFFGNISPL